MLTGSKLRTPASKTQPKRTSIAAFLQFSFGLLKSRLSQRIALWVFASIVAIEIAILIPSYYRREQELLSQLEEVSSEVLTSVKRTIHQGHASENLFEMMIQTLKPDSVILGGALYEADGDLVGTFGEEPELSFARMKDGKTVRRRSRDGNRYDVAWSSAMFNGKYALVVRHDSSSLRREMIAFATRIAALVMIISVFVTVVTMLVLGKTAIVPILRLRDDLIAAGEAIHTDQPNSHFATVLALRQDELGEVASAFEQMFHRIRDEIRERDRAETALRVAQEKSESLLLNVLPKAIAEKLKQDQSAIAYRFEAVTILFADIVDFTGLSARISATELVELLNQIFSTFDQLAERYGLEKIKTIGDAYMVVGGVPTSRPDHAHAIAEMALAMQEEMANFMPDGRGPFKIRVGINTGPVIAGVIGIKKFSYDLWGDAVNVASRMESQGTPGKIQVTEATYKCLKDQYQFHQRGTIEVKGRGAMETYFLVGRQHESLPVGKTEDAEVRTGGGVEEVEG